MNVIQRAFEDHGWHVIMRARTILRNEEEAKDVCQDVFLKLAESYTTLRDADKLTAWIFRVTTNLCIDRLRTRKNHDSSMLDSLSAKGDTQKVSEDHEVILKLMSFLSADDQKLMILRYIDELTLEEMEEVIGQTRKTISKKLEKIKKRSAKLMKKHKLL
jgi:RNA polymerase sigma-70 factor (ECF subfamily)